jgi:sulfur relay protein TusB/DsrH
VSAAAGQAEGVLHLVLGAGSGAFDACRSRCAAGDTVLFLDDGVRRLMTGDAGRLLPPGVALFYSAPDLAARGLAEAAAEARARLLDDDGIPALLARHRHCLSWK